MKYPIQAYELEIKGPDGNPRFLHLQSPLPSWSYLIDHSPLFTRGWCTQEGLLSTRVIHFPPHCIFWECLEAQATEYLPNGGDSEYENIDDIAAGQTIVRPGQLLMSATIPDAHEAWYDLVETYSRTNFTHQADKLVAISSVAGLFEKDIKTTYRAGIWEATLAYGMSWSSLRPKRDPKGRVLAAALQVTGLMGMFCPAEVRLRSTPMTASKIYVDPFEIPWDNKPVSNIDKE
ncbi:hypothetical protein F4801DRAFT_595465 [Xylaria longipes]|nr:hypothetical protein F4801DRAFT_595465 [Xylaria longipes]